MTHFRDSCLGKVEMFKRSTDLIFIVLCWEVYDRMQQSSEIKDHC